MHMIRNELESVIEFMILLPHVSEKGRLEKALLWDLWTHGENGLIIYSEMK